MKLFSKLLFTMFALLAFVSVTSAATGDLRNWMDNLNDEIPFGYLVSQKITVSQVALDKIVIQSPIIQDEFNNKIKKYTVMFSQYPLSQILETPTLLDQAKEKTFDFAATGTGVTMELNAAADGINPNTIYYLSVIPKDQNGILGEISNEIWFKLSNQTYGDGNAPSTTAHTAAGANMTLAHINHTITQNKATLRWTAVDGSNTIDIFLWNPSTQVFDRLSTVNMSAERYEFTLTRNGEYLINFMPSNGGTEHRYTFVASGITPTAGGTTTPNTPTKTPAIGKLPATGPKENMLVVLMITFASYFIYKKAKAKN